MPIEPEILNQIWEHYLKLLASGRGVKPRLTEERTVLISRAVHDYGAAIIKQAIRGCSLSPWHMGHNPNGKKYTSIELILRDSEHIERFASYAEDVDTKGGFLDD